MNARILLRSILVAGLLLTSVSTAEAGKAKDTRFVNPSKPEAKVKPSNRTDWVLRSGATNTKPPKAQANRSQRPSQPKAATPRGNNSISQGYSGSRGNSGSQGYSGSGGNSGANRYGPPKGGYQSKGKSSGSWSNGSKYGNGHNNDYRPGKYGGGYGHSYSPGVVYKPRYAPKYYSSYCGPRSGLSISIGGTYSSYGSYISGAYYSGACRYYPSYRWGYGYNRWGYGWDCAGWGWGPSYYCPPNPFFCSPVSTVVVYNGSSNAYYGGGTYYNANPSTYDGTVYEVQAEPSVNAYRDWQQSGSQTSGIDAVVLPAPAPSGSTSGEHWAPSGRQIEAVRQGWSLVAQGKAREAVAVFAVECELDGRYAPAKVGYAVASALAGEGAAARWGMRRALAIQTQTIAYLPSVDGLTAALNTLSGSLWREYASRPASADDWFFLASVDYLRHDLASASRAAQEAADMGDDSPSLANLMAQIRAESGD
jgi:hypothetical protein